MDVTKQYLTRKGYTEEEILLAKQAGHILCPPNWICHFIDTEFLFSHRRNHYTQDPADYELHAHGYYELVIHVHGSVEYIHNDKRIHPSPYTVMWSSPGTMHSLSHAEGEYERYLMYFSPSFFYQNGKPSSILNFMQNPDVFSFRAEGHDTQILHALLKKTEQTVQSSLSYKALLARSLLIELFDLFNTGSFDYFEPEDLNDHMAQVKRYIDQDYANIAGVHQIAEKFYYSREHLSRQFRARFRISPSEYLSRRRITESINFLPDRNIAEICYAVGFKSQSAYIAAFKKNMGCLPSEYKNQLLQHTLSHSVDSPPETNQRQSVLSSSTRPIKIS